MTDLKGAARVFGAQTGIGHLSDRWTHQLNPPQDVKLSYWLDFISAVDGQTLPYRDYLQEQIAITGDSDVVPFEANLGSWPVGTGNNTGRSNTFARAFVRANRYAVATLEATPSDIIPDPEDSFGRCFVRVQQAIADETVFVAELVAQVVTVGPPWLQETS